MIRASSPVFVVRMSPASDPGNSSGSRGSSNHRSLSGLWHFYFFSRVPRILNKNYLQQAESCSCQGTRQITVSVDSLKQPDAAPHPSPGIKTKQKKFPQFNWDLKETKILTSHPPPLHPKCNNKKKMVMSQSPDPVNMLHNKVDLRLQMELSLLIS